MAENQTTSDFNFYLRFAKTLVLSLGSNRDRFLAAAWLKKLMDEGSGDEAVRTYYLKLMLFGLQKNKLIGPFLDHPSTVEALEPFPQANVMETAEVILKEDKKKRMEHTEQSLADGDLPSYSCDFSADLLEYVAVQEIKNFGVHGYYAVSKQPLSTWHRAEKKLFPRAAKSLIEVATPPQSLMISPTTPDVGKDGEGDGPQFTSTPKKKKKKQIMSTLGASPPITPLGKVVEDSDRRVGATPTWGSNLLNVSEIRFDDDEQKDASSAYYSALSTQDSKSKSDKSAGRLQGGAGGNPGPSKSSSSPEYDMDELEALGLRPEDLEDIDLDDMDDDDDDEDDDDFEEEDDGFQANDKEMDEAISSFERRLAELEAENAEDIAKYGGDVDVGSSSSPSSRSPSRTPPSRSPSRSPAPCPAPCSPGPSLSPSPLPSPRQAFPQDAQLSPRGRTTLSPRQANLVTQEAREVMEEAAEAAAAPAQVNVPRTKPVSRLPTKAAPASTKVQVVPAERSRPKQGPLPRYMAHTSATRSKSLVEPGPSRLARPSTSLIARPSASRIGQPATASRYLQPTISSRSKSPEPGPSTSLPASRIGRPSTSLSASRLAVPSTSRIAQPGTSRIAQPGTSRIAQPGTSRIAQPGTSRIAQPGTSRIAQPGTSRIGQPSTSIRRPAAAAAPAPVPRRTQAEEDLASEEYWTTFNRQLESEFAARPTTVQVDEEFDDSFDDLERAIEREMRSKGEDPQARQGQGSCPSNNKDPIIGKMFDAAAKAAKRKTGQRRAREQMRQLMEDDTSQQQQTAAASRSAAELSQAGVSVESMAPVELGDLGLDLDDFKLPKAVTGQASTSVTEQQVEYAATEEDSYTDLNINLRPTNTLYPKVVETDQYVSNVQHLSPALAASVPTTSPRPIPSPRRSPRSDLDIESPPDYGSTASGSTGSRSPGSPGSPATPSPQKMQTRPGVGSPGRQQNLEAIEDAVNDQLVQQGVERSIRRKILQSPATQAKIEELNETVQENLITLDPLPDFGIPAMAVTAAPRAKSLSPPKKVTPVNANQLATRGDEVESLSATTAPLALYQPTPDTRTLTVARPDAVASQERKLHEFMRKGKKVAERSEDYSTPVRTQDPRTPMLPASQQHAHSSVMRMAVRRRLDFDPEPGSSEYADEDSKVEVEQTMTRIMDDGPYTEEDYNEALDQTLSPGLVSPRTSPRRSPASPLSPMSRPETMAQVLHDVRNYDGKVSRKMSLTSWSTGKRGESLRQTMAGRLPGSVDEDEEEDLSFEELEEKLGAREVSPTHALTNDDQLMAVMQKASDQIDALKTPPTSPKTPPREAARRARRLIDLQARARVEREMRALQEEEDYLINTLDNNFGLPQTPQRTFAVRSPTRLTARSPPKERTATDEAWALAAYGDGGFLDSTSPPGSPLSTPEMAKAAALRQLIAGYAGDTDPLDEEEMPFPHVVSPPPSPDAPSAKHRRLTVVTPERTVVQNTDMSSPTASGVAALNQVYDDVVMAENVTRAVTNPRVVPGAWSPRSKLNKASLVKQTPEGQQILFETTKMKSPKAKPKASTSTGAIPKRRSSAVAIPVRQTRAATLRAAKTQAAAKGGGKTPAAAGTSKKARAKATTLDPKEVKELGLNKEDLKDLTKLMSDQWKTQDRQEKETRQKLNEMYSQLSPAARLALVPMDPYVMKTPPKHRSQTLTTQRAPSSQTSGLSESLPLPIRSPTRSPTGSPESMSEMQRRALITARAFMRGQGAAGVRPVGGRHYQTKSGKLSPLGEFEDEDLFELDTSPMEEIYDTGAGMGPVGGTAGRAVVPVLGTTSSPRTPKKSSPVPAAFSPRASSTMVADDADDDLMDVDDDQPAQPILTMPRTPPRTPVRSPTRLTPEALERSNRLEASPEYAPCTTEASSARSPARTPPQTRPRTVPPSLDTTPSPATLRRNVQRHQYTDQAFDVNRAMLSGRATGTTNERMVPVRGQAKPGLQQVPESASERALEPWRTPIRPYTTLPTPEELQSAVSQHRFTRHYHDLNRRYMSRRLMVGRTGREMVLRGSRQPRLSSLSEQLEDPVTGQLIDTSEGVNVITTRDNATGRCVGFERHRVQAPYIAPPEEDDEECPGTSCN